MAIQRRQYTLRVSRLSVLKYVRSEPEKGTQMYVNFTTNGNGLQVQ